MKRSDIYKAISTIARAELQGLVLVDLQKQQVRRQSECVQLPLPALFVEFKAINYTQTGNRSQIGSAIVTLCLYVDLLTNTFNGAELENETIELLDKADEIFESFHCRRLGNEGMMTRQTDLSPEYGPTWMALKSDYKITVKDMKDSEVENASAPTIKILTTMKV